MYVCPKGIVLFFVAIFLSGFATGSAGQEIPLKDDFESQELSTIWQTKNLPRYAIRHINEPVRTGQRAIEIRVISGDKAAIGGDGQMTERAEVREASHVRLRMGVESWYAFSFFLPADFPIVDNRLVIASWKQSFKEPWKDRSPMVSLRYIDGQLRIYVERDRGQRTVYSEEFDLRNRWIDMVFHILPKASKKIPIKFKDGLLQVWKNGKQIVDYKGALGFVDDEDDVYFRMGLYRDRMPEPMRIYFDRFRRGKSYNEVSITGN